MIHGITYATENISKSGKLCEKSMKLNGVDKIPWSFKPLTINDSDNFYRFNDTILKSERGAGYWLWKPYIIMNSIAGMHDGDILIYSDAGVEFINNVNHIIDRMDQDVWLFGNMYDHVKWCKQECMDMMNIYEVNSRGEFIHDFSIKQAQASVIFIRVSPFSRKFIKEWLLWCQMPGCIDDEFDPAIQHPQFKEHRHDQAILTNLAIKHDIKLHYWPASYNNGAFEYSTEGYDRSIDNYPILFNHHRKRNNEY